MPRTSQPFLSIVIPCFRSGEPLTWQLDALVHQRSAPPREILLCDNGGNPGLAEVVQAVSPLSDDVQIRIIEATKHRGAAYARNRGIAAARADLLAFCDDDDLVHPDWCRQAVDLLAEHPVVSGGIVVMDHGDLEALGPAERRAILEERTMPVPPRPARRGSIGPALMGGNFAARREVLVSVGGFDSSLVRGGEDNDLAYRLEQAGIPIVDAGAMSIIYARPSATRDRMRVRRNAGRSLADVAAARDAWDAAPELRRPPFTELARASGALARMAVGAKSRVWAGGVDRVATAWGLTVGWAERLVLRRPLHSKMGHGLNDDSAAWSRRRPGTTVLVVAYNHAPYVIETLESIAAQTVPPTRVLIADDASPGDDTRAVIEKWVASAPPTFEFQPNRENVGLNRTLNRLLAQVDTEFVTYIAGDDTMEPHRIEAQAALLSSSSEDVVLAYSDARVIGPSSELLHCSSRTEFPWPEEPARSADTLACLVKGNWIPAASLFLRSDVLQREGGYAEDLFYEDFELLTRLAARHRFVYTEDSLVSVRRLDTSLGAVGFAHNSPRFIRSMIRALKNAEEGPSLTARQHSRRARWELSKRARRVGMPVSEVRSELWSSARGARTPVHAMAHLVINEARGLLGRH